MTEDKLQLLENAVIGLQKKIDSLEDKINRGFNLRWAMEMFRRKRDTERKIAKELRFTIIPLLKKIDLDRLDRFYSESKKFKDAVKYMEKAIKDLEWI